MDYKYLVVVDEETDEAVFEREYKTYPAELIEELHGIYPPPRYSIELVSCSRPLERPHHETRSILSFTGDLSWLGGE